MSQMNYTAVRALSGTALAQAFPRLTIDQLWWIDSPGRVESALSDAQIQNLTPSQLLPLLFLGGAQFDGQLFSKLTSAQFENFAPGDFFSLLIAFLPQMNQVDPSVLLGSITPQQLAACPAGLLNILPGSVTNPSRLPLTSAMSDAQFGALMPNWFNPPTAATLGPYLSKMTTSQLTSFAFFGQNLDPTIVDQLSAQLSLEQLKALLECQNTISLTGLTPAQIAQFDEELIQALSSTQLGQIFTQLSAAQQAMITLPQASQMMTMMSSPPGQTDVFNLSLAQLHLFFPGGECDAAVRISKLSAEQIQGLPSDHVLYFAPWLSWPQIGALTPAQWSSFASADVASVGFANGGAVNENAGSVLAAMPVAQSQMLSASQVAALSRNSSDILPKLTAQQLQWISLFMSHGVMEYGVPLSAAQVAALPTPLFAQLVNYLQPLAGTQQSLPAAQIQALTAVEVQTLCPSAPLFAVLLPDLTAGQIQAFTTRQLYELPNPSGVIAKLSPSQLGILNSSQRRVAAIDAGALSAAQIEALLPAPWEVLLLNSLGAAQIQLLSTACIAALGLNELLDVLPSLTPIQLQSLTPYQLNWFYRSGGPALGDGQLQALTPQQVQPLLARLSGAGKLGLLSSAQLGRLPIAQLEQMIAAIQSGAQIPGPGNIMMCWMTPAQMQALPAQTITQLMPDVLALQMWTLTPAQAQELSTMQVQALLPPMLTGLDQLFSQIASRLYQQQWQGLGPSRGGAQAWLASLNAAQIPASLSTAQLDQLSAKQIAALSGQQISQFIPVLSGAFIAQLSPSQVAALGAVDIEHMSAAQLLGLFTTQGASALTAPQLGAVSGTILSQVIDAIIPGPGQAYDPRIIPLLPHFSTAQIQKLGGAHLMGMLASGGIPFSVFQQLTGGQVVQCFCGGEIPAANLTAAQIPSLTSGQLAALLGFNWSSGFPAALLAATTVPQVQGFTLAQIQMLGCVTHPGFAAKLSPAQVKQLTAFQLGQCPIATLVVYLPNLSDTQAAQLSPLQLWSFSGQTLPQGYFQQLSKAALGMVLLQCSATQLAAITDAQIAQFTGGELAALLRLFSFLGNQAGMQDALVPGLTDPQILTLAPDQLSALAGFLEPPTLTRLLPGFSLAQQNAIQLRIAQVGFEGDVGPALAVLSPQLLLSGRAPVAVQDMATLPVETVALAAFELTTAHFAALTEAQVRALDVGTMPIQFFETPSVYAHLSAAQLAAIPTLFLCIAAAKVPPTVASSLSVHQLAAMLPSTGNAAALIANMTPAQKAGLYLS